MMCCQKWCMSVVPRIPNCTWVSSPLSRYECWGTVNAHVFHHWVWCIIPLHHVSTDRHYAYICEYCVQHIETYSHIFLGTKTTTRGICCHNAQGHMENSSSKSKANRPRDLTNCLKKPECIATTNPSSTSLNHSYSMSFSISPPEC